MDTIWLALIAVGSVLITGTVSPMLLAWQINKHRRLEKLEDYARQDAVAAQVREVKRSLTETTAVTNGKLDGITTMVDGTLTVAMQSDLDSTKRTLVLLQEMVADKKATDQEPNLDTLTEIEEAKKKIATLSVTVADRLKAVVAVEQQQQRRT